MDETSKMVSESISRTIHICETQWDYLCSSWRLTWDLAALWFGNESSWREAGIRPTNIQRKRD